MRRLSCGCGGRACCCLAVLQADPAGCQMRLGGSRCLQTGCAAGHCWQRQQRMATLQRRSWLWWGHAASAVPGTVCCGRILWLSPWQVVQLWDQCCWGLCCAGERPLSALPQGAWGLTLLDLRHPAAAGGRCCCWLLKGLLSRQCHPLLWNVVSAGTGSWALLPLMLQHQGQLPAVQLCALQVGGRSSCRWGTAHGGTAGRCGRSCHNAHTRVLCRHHPGVARGTSRTPGRHHHTCKCVQLSCHIMSLVRPGFQLDC